MSKSKTWIGFALGVGAVVGAKVLIEKTHALNTLQSKYDTLMEELDMIDRGDNTDNLSGENKKILELFKKYPTLESICVEIGEKIKEFTDKTGCDVCGGCTGDKTGHCSCGHVDTEIKYATVKAKTVADKETQIDHVEKVTTDENV